MRVASEFDARPRDYVRLDAVLRYGLERRVGERLSSTAGRVYAALLQLEREAPGYGVCKRCHVVWSGRRADAVLCEQCRVTRIPTVPSEEGGWLAVPGPRFNASLEDMRHRLVQADCAGCGKPFMRPTDRHKYCKPACRQLAYRRRHGA